MVRHRRGVDGGDQPIGLPPPSSSRTVTILESHGAKSTALVHDAVLNDPDLAEAVLAAIRFVVGRQRLEREPGPSVDLARLPTGVVTHLFTDIEGSTELLTELTDRCGGLLDRSAR